MKDDLPIYNSERAEALTWLRGVLTAMLEVSPLSYQQNNRPHRTNQEKKTPEENEDPNKY